MLAVHLTGFEKLLSVAALRVSTLITAPTALVAISVFALL